MRKTLFVLLVLLAAPAAAQKWVDEKGKVYYGDPPAGVKVKPAEMKGGGVGVATGNTRPLNPHPVKGEISPGSKFSKGPPPQDPAAKK